MLRRPVSFSASELVAIYQSIAIRLFYFWRIEESRRVDCILKFIFQSIIFLLHLKLTKMWNTVKMVNSHARGLKRLNADIIRCSLSSGGNCQLQEYWMPFTHNRGFKVNPRLLDHANGVFYYMKDGTELLDGMAGLWCVNAGHGQVM